MADKKRIVSPDTQRAERMPPGQWGVGSFPVLNIGRVPPIGFDDWRLRLFGAVKAEKELTWAELNDLPQAEVYADIHCVTTWSKLDNTFVGVPTTELRRLVDIDPGAGYVMIHSADGYSTNLALADFFGDDCLIATELDGELLDPDNGGPVRVVIPRLYYWKSAKWVVGLEFMTADRPGYWETRGYHNHGDPWTEERYGD